jgi:uncharacterized protein YndB with AHSA1/START domain
VTVAAGKRVVIARTYRAPVEELWALWTTKAGFESWWGPGGFRADVRSVDARKGGSLHYAMVADSPEAINAMKQMGQPTSTETHGWFSEFAPPDRLVLTHMIDFFPGVEPYESTIEVDFFPAGAETRMVVTLHQMHDEGFSRMQQQGFTSQLAKLDKRYGWS